MLGIVGAGFLFESMVQYAEGASGISTMIGLMVVFIAALVVEIVVTVLVRKLYVAIQSFAASDREFIEDVPTL